MSDYHKCPCHHSDRNGCILNLTFKSDLDLSPTLVRVNSNGNASVCQVSLSYSISSYEEVNLRLGQGDIRPDLIFDLEP